MFALFPHGNDREICLDTVLAKDETDELFGFVIKNDDRAQVTSDVNDFCPLVYAVLYPPTQGKVIDRFSCDVHNFSAPISSFTYLYAVYWYTLSMPPKVLQRNQV